ncbi:BV2 protein [Watermelon chlorotic stunt virus-[SD]]|nr:BV2 protein [Watermelon chlorotic stunt virus-[SD]]
MLYEIGPQRLLCLTGPHGTLTGLFFNLKKIHGIFPPISPRGSNSRWMAATCPWFVHSIFVFRLICGLCTYGPGIYDSVAPILRCPIGTVFLFRGYTYPPKLYQ